MYLIHCECSRLCWVRTLSLLSVGCLSCFVVHLSHRCCHCCCCCCPRDIYPVEASSPSSSGRGLVIRPPRCHRRPQAVCPAEVSSSSLSSGPHCLSPTSSSSSTGHLPCKGLVAIVVWWGVMLSVPRRCCCHCRPPPTSSLSLSVGHLPCKGLVAVIVRWGLRCLSPTVVTVVVIGHPPHCCCCCCLQAICPAEASSLSSSSGGLVVHSLCRCRCRWGSSSTPHVIIVVVRGSFVLRRPHPCHCLVGASSSLPHIIIDVDIIIHRPFVLQRPHRRRCPFGATSSVPHHCRHHHCLVGASSSLPHVVVVVIVRGSFVLWRPCHHCCLVGLPPCRSLLTVLASSSSTSSLLSSGKGLIIHC